MEAVSRRFGKIQALKKFNLNIDKGEIVAILGPNGAGKTTALNILLGLQPADSGKVSVLGYSPGDIRARQQLGVMLQQTELAETLKVSELINLFASYYPKPLNQNDILQAAGLRKFSERFYGKLSGGEKRRVQFAIALAGQPKLMFLDEPTTGLDIQARQQLWRSIREAARLGCSVILTTHYLEEADQLAHRIVIMREGRAIANGTPQAIKQRIAVRRIRCRTHTDVSRLKNFPGIHRWRQQGSELQVLTREVEPLVLALLRQDPQLSDLEVGGAGLDEAFLALTESPLEDAT